MLGQFKGPDYMIIMIIMAYIALFQALIGVTEALPSEPQSEASSGEEALNVSVNPDSGYSRSATRSPPHKSTTPVNCRVKTFYFIPTRTD